MGGNDGLEEVMAGLAAGDMAYVTTLYERYGDNIERAVCSHLRDMGRWEVLGDADEVTGLVIDACFVIADRSGGWRPGRASPWKWADRAIRAQICRALGHRTIELDEADEELDGQPAGAPATSGRPYDTLLAADPRMARFDAALRAVASERDYEVFVEHFIQQALGDPSPSQTVAGRVGLRADHVRQIACRTRARLRELLAEDDWADLAGVGWAGVA